MPGRGTLLAGTALVLTLSLGDGAAATTICVPGFRPDCPNSGGNKQTTDIEQAMSLDGSDGEPDQVLLAAGTYTEGAGFEPGGGSSETLEPGGSDPLTVIGAGPAASIVTSAATGNVYIVNLAYNNTRAITIKDLTLRVPASVADGMGGALQMDGDTLEDVDIVSRNEGSDGIASTVGSGNVFRDGEVRGEAGGTVDYGLRAGSPAGGSLLVEDALVNGASWALVTGEAGSTLTARRVSEIGTRTYGAIASGGDLIIENSTMRIANGTGLYASAGVSSTSLHADHITVVNEGSSYPALETKKFGPSAGNAQLVVSNSILRGFSSGYKEETPVGPGVGQIGIEARYSNLPLTGTSVNGAIDLDIGDLNVDPLLNADLTLPASSPAVDAGDPAPGGLASDFIGTVRPLDGNGDGSAIPDQGAFEYQPPTLIVDPGGDVEPPQTKIAKGPGKALRKGVAKFRFRSSEAGSTFTCRLDKRKPKPCRSPKAYKHLKSGKHVFRVWAVDAAGNKDPTPAKRKFRVPAAS